MSPASLTAPTSWITDIDFLSVDECARIRSAIQDMREHWLQRHPLAPFFTLGPANYFDIAYNPLLPYYRLAARYNPMLLEKFGWLYRKLTSAIEEHLGAPAEYRLNFALPGFHIFLSDSAFHAPADLTHLEWFKAKGKKEVVGNAIHCDTAHLVVDWGSRDGLEIDEPISITVSIALPRAGAGLNYWDFGLERTQGMSQPEIRDLLLASPKHFHPYHVGAMVIHSGLRYHQMAAMPEMEPGDERITLQGHAVRQNGVWQLFW
jgi:hypothetical protein